MKKLSLLLGLSLLIISASPASARLDFNRSMGTDSNFTMVKSTTEAGAFTGYNTQYSGVSVEKAGVDDIFQMSYNSLHTGSANANANSTLMVNANHGCNTCMNQTRMQNRETNFTMVEANTIAQADTGMNAQQNGVTVERAHVDDITNMGTNKLCTGTANANANSLTLVNVEWNHGGMMMPR